MTIFTVLQTHNTGDSYEVHYCGPSRNDAITEFINVGRKLMTDFDNYSSKPNWIEQFIDEQDAVHYSTYVTGGKLQIIKAETKGINE